MKLSARPFQLIFCLACAVFTVNAQAPLVKKQYSTQKMTATGIELDGIPNEAAWQDVPWEGDFIQSRPDDGKAPSQQTNFKILYDDKFLYLGFRCHDTATDSIVERMGRRDEFPGDWIEVNIDSYHDLRTAFSFSLSVSGVKGDEFVSDNGGNWDTSWNPIWYAKTSIDSAGWTAEMKIPFSQLRYGKTEKPVWGMQFTRRLFRKEERSTWQHIPQNAGVWVSAFGELHGLEGVEPQRQIEIQPY
ncbi:MAG: carbohydrate binding family 9 domain-containing protein, partial [Bacteroidota bacterium]